MKFRSFDTTTSKHFYHYIQSTLNDENVKSDIAVLHIGKNDIIDKVADKDLILEGVTDIAKESVRFSVKDLFVSSVTVDTRRSSTFISAINKILQDKCARLQFHFIDNSNIKKHLRDRSNWPDWPSSQSVR